MSYTIKFKKNNLYESEYVDLKIDDNNNVHQDSVIRKIRNCITNLENTYNIKCNQCDYDNYLNEILEYKDFNKKSELLIRLIFIMNLYSKNMDRNEPYLLYLIYKIIKLKAQNFRNDNNANNDNNGNKFYEEQCNKLNNNLLDCYEGDQIVCIDGRIARIFQTLEIGFLSLWEYKEKITDTLLYFINNLIKKNNSYRNLCNKNILSENERLQLWLMNYELIKFLNKKFNREYIKPDLLCYKVIKAILLSIYKELFLYE